MRPCCLLVASIGFSMAGFALSTSTVSVAVTEASPSWTTVFRKNQKKKRVYRIPCLVWVPPKLQADSSDDGQLLAFAERRRSTSDSGNITIVLRISSNAGKSWSQERELFAVEDFGLPEEVLTIGNPTAVFDKYTGKVVLLFVAQFGKDREQAIWKRTSRGSRWVFTSASSDAGKTWSLPRNITKSVKKKEWTWYATGPGSAIQVDYDKFKGRLVVPCDHVRSVKGRVQLRSHLIYSDDGGENWKIGANTQADTNECAVAELANGTLLINSRDWSGKNRRVMHTSIDGGATWDGRTPYFDQALREPAKRGCQAAMISHASELRRGSSRLLLFSNPDSHGRKNLTLKLSSSNGQAWEKSHVLHAGGAAYSALAVLPPAVRKGSLSEESAEFRVACLFERWESDSYARIDLAVLSITEHRTA